MNLFGLPVWHFVFSALGVAGVGWTLAKVWEASRARTWPSAEGEITGVGLLRRVDADGDVQFGRWVRYRFEAGGRPYEQSRIRFGESVQRDGDRGFVAVTPEAAGVDGGSVTGLARAAAGDDARYEEGQRVRVYYDPADPQNCVLDRRLHVDVLWVGAASLAALGYGLVALFQPA